MATYIHELLRIDALGNATTSYLSVQDDDALLTSQEASATYTLDGTTLAHTPTVLLGIADFTLPSGAVDNSYTMYFELHGSTYYLLQDDLPADAVIDVSNVTEFSTAGGIGYTLYGATHGDLPRSYQGQALWMYYTDAGDLLQQEAKFVTVYDDDRLIQFNGAHGAPKSETGLGAIAALAYQGRDVAFNDTDAGKGNTHMVLVRIAYTGPNGAGSFEAINYMIDDGSSYAIAYIPRTGSVDLNDVGTVTSVTVLKTSLDGMKYADFGLISDPVLTRGTAANDVMTGTWLNDKFTGLGGTDLLFGSTGDDQLFGGSAADVLYGGMQGDTLSGEGGGDALYGGSYDDSLSGGDDTDSLTGGWGDDSLDGGKGSDLVNGEAGDDALAGAKGNDTLIGGDGRDKLDGGAGSDSLSGGFGNDRLTDGTGSDTLTGNAGADTFVFGIDGQTDTVTDFADKIDHIDLTVGFARLTLTTIAPGEVHITHSGETLILFDDRGLLTAANLTAADFI